MNPFGQVLDRLHREGIGKSDVNQHHVQEANTNFEGLFQQRIETLHREGRYRVFAARGTERMRLTPSPAHSDEQMAKLIRALDELWAACPVSNGTYVRLAAE